MYAVVDIETTGGYAANNDITEVAIVCHDGEKVTHRFQSLVKARRQIPRYIQILTGITPDMLAAAPDWEELAPIIHDLLQGKIFVAHNVNFDYSFLKYHLGELGLNIDLPRLCTVRLSKKVFPGLPSYSLGNLCRHFGIENPQRHRAGGDAQATTEILEILLRNNAEPHIQAFTRRHAKEQSLPTHLPPEDVEQLPYTPGVYYFHNQKGQVIYVGKAKNLKYRVRSHFSHHGAGRQRQEFLRHIYHISFQPCDSELMAFVLENVEIRRLWPKYNNSQKRFQARYGLYKFEDQAGYQRLAIDRLHARLSPLHTFGLLPEGHNLLHQLIRRYGLCPKFCFIQAWQAPCQALEEGICRGTCEGNEDPVQYNARVEDAIRFLEAYLPTFAILEESVKAGEKACFLVEKGRFYGMGSLPEGTIISHPDELKPFLKEYPESDYIRGLLYAFAEKRPDSILKLQHREELPMTQPASPA